MRKFNKFKKAVLGCMAAVFALMAPNAVMADETKVEVYDLPACYKESEDMSVSVNGKDVPVIQYVGLYDHANFSFEGEVEVTVTVPKDIEHFSISPLAHELEGTVEGNKLTFRLEDSKYLLIKIDGYKELALAADDLETDVPKAEGEGIYNIAKAPYNGSGSTPDSPNDALQRAIDDASGAGGGIVYVPNGVYYTKNVVLKSNVSLYLEPSAVIRGTGNWEDYENHFHKDSINQDGTWFITNEPGAENIKVYGRGFLDGNGHIMRQKGHLNNLFFTMQLSGLEVDGVTFKDAGFWMVMINRSDNVTIQNVKFYNENDIDLENDAIDICESQDVLVQHTIAISEDDTYSTKTWGKTTDIATNWPGEAEEIENVTFDDCFGWSRCCTFKIGAGCFSPQKNVTFKNSYSYKSMVAMKITPAYSDSSQKSYVENVTFENIDIEGFWPQKNEWHISMWMQLEAQAPNIPIYNTVVKDIRVRTLDSRMVKSRINGRSNAKFEWVVLENITLPGMDRPARNLEELGLTTNGFCEDLIILPADIPMDEKKIVLHDDFSKFETDERKTEEYVNVEYDGFQGNNGGAVKRLTDSGESFVTYKASGADGIEIRVNSYEDNKFPVKVYASVDEYGTTMNWKPLELTDKEHGDYNSSDYHLIEKWKWDTYESSLPENVKYVKIEIPVPNSPKLWAVNLDDVLLYSNEEIKPTFELRPSQQNMRMKEGEKITLYPNITNIKDPVIRYESSNPETAEVDDKGAITALAQGDTVVKAVLEGTGLEAEAKIHVYKEITELSISETEIVLDKGDTYQLEAVVDPEDSDEILTWSSMNDKIASVDENGEVTALRYGSTVIMCETENHKWARCSVEVSRSGANVLLHDPLSNKDFPEGMMAAEATENLAYDGFQGATDGGIKRINNEEDAWLIYKVEEPKYVQYKLNYNIQTNKLQDEIHVSVSKDGEEWTAVEMLEVDRLEDVHFQWNQVSRINKEAFVEGVQYIKLAIPKIEDLGNGTRFWALIIEDVEILGEPDKIEKIEVDGPEKIKAGSEAVYSAVITPKQAAEKTVIWSVTDRSGNATELAVIDTATGKLKALETGEIRVTAEAADGSGVSGSLDVEIVKDAILIDTIVIEGETVLGFHETAAYTALIFPENADDQRIEWLLEDKSHEDIAVISEDGVVETGEIEGTFVIKASASDASRAVGTLKVRVREEAEESIPVEEIEIEGPDQVMQGEKVRYKAVATPANATKKDVVWTVQNMDGKADITNSGLLTAREPGEVKIIAAATDGSGVMEELVVEILKKKSSGSGSSDGGSSTSRPVRRYYKSSTGNASDWRKDDRGWWLAGGPAGYAKDEWKFVDGKWYFFGSDGYMVTGWKRLNQGNWYYMMLDGAMATGWIQVEGEWYYFYPSGDMASDCVTPDGWFVDSNGRWDKAGQKEK